jgi:hypothetical protein
LSAGAGSYAGAEAANASSLLHPLAASVGSISVAVHVAVQAFWDQVVWLFNAAGLGLLLDLFEAILGLPLAIPFVAFLVFAELGVRLQILLSQVHL